MGNFPGSHDQAEAKDSRSDTVDYRRLFHSLPGSVLILRADAHFTMCGATRSYLEHTGKSDEELIGRGLFEVFHEVARENTSVDESELRHSLRDVVRTKRSHVIPVQRFEFGGHIGSNRVSYWTVENSPVFDDDGEVLYILHQLLRQTHQETLENERENFRNLFRQTPEMVCITYGPEHTFEFVNKAHITALGFDATGLAVREAQPESIEVHGILDEVYRSGVTAELREIPVTLGNSLRYFNLTYAARRDPSGAVNGVMILGNEITQQVDARVAMERARKLSDSANESKSNFIANMSHEIRTPMGVIMGFCEILRDEELPPEERRQFLQRIIRNAQSLTRIIDDILDLAKVEAGKLELEESEFSLVELVREVLDSFSEKANDKGIDLKLESDEEFSHRVYSDPLRLRQVLINIVGNAIKFTAQGSVAVKISVDRSGERARYKVSVTDTGIGLSQEQVHKLFKPFVQADGGTSRVYGGTGLGLIISLKLAEALGGSLELTQFALGEGCTFVLEFTDSLALVSDLPLLSAQEDSLSQRLEGIRLLLAEDSPDNQIIIKRMLNARGAEVHIVENGEEALSRVLDSAEEYDAILMDVQMPRVDGYEATRLLRNAGYTKPIFALTAHAMMEEREKTKLAGCDAHLTKPIQAQELIATIRKHVLIDAAASKPQLS